MIEITNPVKEQLHNGEISLGVAVRLSRTVDIVHLMKSSGFDWLFIDLEHSTIPLDTAAQICTAALGFAIPPIVRVPPGELTMATRILDAGAQGIVMPHVDTPEAAAALVRALKYPPQGDRSVGGPMPVMDYAPATAQATAAANNATLVVAMLETETAIANAEAIAAIDGIDSLMIGTNDLSVDLGIHGELDNPRITEAYSLVVAACLRHGKSPGMAGVYRIPLMQEYIALGMRLILAGSDQSFVQDGAKARVQALRPTPEPGA